MVIDSNLLNMIVNPTVIDPGEQYRAGQEQREELGKAKLMNKLFQHRVDMAPIELSGAKRQEAQAVKSSAIKDTLSYAMSASLYGQNEKKQNEFLNRMVAKAQETGIPQAIEMATAVQQSPYGDQRNKAIDYLVKMGQQQGYLNMPQQPRAGTGKTFLNGASVRDSADGRIVRNPEGKIVTGKEAAEVLKAANNYEIEVSTRKAGGKTQAQLQQKEILEPKIAAKTKAATDATGLATKMAEKIGGIKGNIQAIDRAISALDEGDGAKTGVFQKFMPTIRASSNRLKQVQSELGLNVIQNTTFGSLSEAELKFALSSALPSDKLNSKELRKWLVNKKYAQEVLSGYLEGAAIYLGSPGNTIAGWVELNKGGSYGRENLPAQKGGGAQPPPNPSGAPGPDQGGGPNIINFDAQGNIIP